MFILIIVLTASAGLAGWLMLRSTPLDEALAAIQQRDYFFEEDPDADPGLSPTKATSMATFGEKPSLGPVAGFLTHDSRPTRRVDLDDQPVYLFVVDELRDHGPVLTGPPPGPSRHVVFIYEQGGAVSTTAIPLED